jgi:hypothetical protein
MTASRYRGLWRHMKALSNQWHPKNNGHVLILATNWRSLNWGGNLGGIECLGSKALMSLAKRKYSECNELGHIAKYCQGGSTASQRRWWCFLHRQDIGWSRSCVPISRWSCELRKTTKHTIVYPSSGTCYRVIALHPAFLYWRRITVLQSGELRAREVR